MSRDFSSVGTSAPGKTGGPAAVSTTSGRTRRGLLSFWPIATALGVVLLLVVGITAIVGGGSDDGAPSTETDAIRAAHGPTTTLDGIPAGYTRDEAGAQTAAVNFIQANGQAYAGRIDGARLREVAVSSTPTPALTEVIDISSDRQETGRTGSYSDVPLIVTVRNFTQDAATVSVWGMGVGQTPVAENSDKLGILTVYSTSTVTVAWENDDWKARDWSYETGPDPATAQFPADGTALAEQGANGFYTFYVD